MGIVERKEREREEMRKLIIEAAIKMFVEEGYEKTSIRNIAEKIEYSPATIYLYYKDKDELLYDVQKLAFEELSIAFQKEVTAEEPFERLVQIGHAYLLFAKQHPELYDLMFIIKAPMNTIENKELWTNGHDSFAFLVQCISECMEKGLLRFDDVMIGALSVWSMAHGLVSLDLRCRFKVMDMSEEAVDSSILKSMHDYLQMIKK